MGKRMRYGLLVPAFAALLVALAACGGGGASSNAVAAKGPIKIWLSNNAQEISWGKAVVKQWNKDHPKEQVKA